MSSYSYIYYLHGYKLCRCARTRIIPPSRPGMQPLVLLLCGIFCRSNRNYYLLVLVTRALTMSTNVRRYLPKFDIKTHYYDAYCRTMGLIFTVKILRFGTKYYAKLEMSSKLLIYQLLQPSKIKRPAREYSSKYLILATSRLPLFTSVRVREQEQNA